MTLSLEVILLLEPFISVILLLLLDFLLFRLLAVERQQILFMHVRYICRDCAEEASHTAYLILHDSLAHVFLSEPVRFPAGQVIVEAFVGKHTYVVEYIPVAEDATCWILDVELVLALDQALCLRCLLLVVAVELL